MYVSISKNDDYYFDVTDETIHSQRQYWQRANHCFEEEMDKDKNVQI